MKNLKKLNRQELKSVNGKGVNPPLITVPLDENGHCNYPYGWYCPKFNGCMTSESWDFHCA
ncbi:bacteriocin-like protein [Chryseobacterium sp. NFX27]|uniref:bacteriocin-like protein n=1 Tax=Chryseobacterium sp. NFX27 TaxID=2819618 RepID=UPI003CEB372A